jgi:uncharacterized membrane protein YbhN (UPF0104 family)
VRTLKTVLLLLGAALLVALVYRVGAEPILETLRRLTWWQFALICLPYALMTAVDTLGWRFAFAHDRAPFWRLYGARLAGEALNLVTAVGAVGGEAAKAWLMRRDVSYEDSVPSVIIAKTTATVAQALFLAIGLAVALCSDAVDRQVAIAMAALLGVEIALTGGFVAVQLAGLVARGGRLVVWTGLAQDAAHAEQLDRSLRGYYLGQPGRCALSVGLHLAGWLLGAVEAAVMLLVLHVPAGPVLALVIESLGSGVRFASFLVPGAVGVLEGANTGAFAALGLGAGAGLAFTLVRRARQAVWIAIGLIVLVVARVHAARAEVTPLRAAP